MKESSRKAQNLEPDLVLLDLQLAGVGCGYDLIRPLVATGATVAMLTGVTDRIQLALCLEAGASGVLSKAGSFSGLVEQVERAATGPRRHARHRAGSGRPRRQARHRAGRICRGAPPAPGGRTGRTAPFEALSRRESEVLGMITDGMSARDMASEGYVSVTTVRTQIRSLFQKLGVNSQLEAAAMARAWG